MNERRTCTYIHMLYITWILRNLFRLLQSFRLVRERKRVAWILLLLAFVFAVCWLPYNTVNLLRDAGTHINIYCTHYLLLLGHANSALNPIIYCVMSRNFRRSVKELICRTRINFECRRNQRIRVSNMHLFINYSFAAMQI